MNRVGNWFRRAITEFTDGLTIGGRTIKWGKPHGKGTYGHNGFGARFFIYDMSSGYPPEKRWSLTASPLCPDGRRFCSEHDQRVYHGPDYDEAKQVAQQWSNKRWPLLRH